MMIKQFSIHRKNTHIHVGALMWIRTGAAAPCFRGPGKRGRQRRGGVFVHRARQSSGCAWGPRPPRERLATVKVLTHRERQRKKDRERERERMGVEEWGSGERKREREHFLEFLSFSLLSSMAFSPWPTPLSDKQKTLHSSVAWPANQPAIQFNHIALTVWNQSLILGVGVSPRMLPAFTYRQDLHFFLPFHHRKGGVIFFGNPVSPDDATNVPSNWIRDAARLIWHTFLSWKLFAPPSKFFLDL